MKKIYLDIGSNHNQDFTRAKLLIEEAADIRDKCGYIAGIKFQLFHPDRLYAPGTKYSPDFEKLKLSQLPLEWIPYLADKAEEHELEMGLTVFDMGSLVDFDDLRDQYKIKVYMKISSSDLLRHDIIESSALLANCMGTRLHISTGGATSQEICAAIKVASGITIDFPIVYHCAMNYPCAPEDAKLSRIHTLADIIYGIGKFESYLQAYDYVGYSDHTALAPVVTKAFSWIKTCELHFDLDDKCGRETSIGHCWTSAMLRELCKSLTIAEVSGHDDFRCIDLDLRADPIDGLRPRMKHREDI